MIAQIAFTWMGGPATATLGDDQRWTCPDVPSVARALDARYEPGGPADGIAGRVQAQEAAEFLDGKLTLAPVPAYPDDPNRVY